MTIKQLDPKIKKAKVKATKLIKNNKKTDKDGNEYVIVNGKKVVLNEKLTERQLILQMIKLFLKKRRKRKAVAVKKDKNGNPTYPVSVGRSGPSGITAITIQQPAPKPAQTAPVPAGPALTAPAGPALTAPPVSPVPLLDGNVQYTQDDLNKIQQQIESIKKNAPDAFKLFEKDYNMLTNALKKKKEEIKKAKDDVKQAQDDVKKEQEARQQAEVDLKHKEETAQKANQLAVKAQEKINKEIDDYRVKIKAEEDKYASELETLEKLRQNPLDDDVKKQFTEILSKGMKDGKITTFSNKRYKKDKVDSYLKRLYTNGDQAGLSVLAGKADKLIHNYVLENQRRAQEETQKKIKEYQTKMLALQSDLPPLPQQKVAETPSDSIQLPPALADIPITPITKTPALVPSTPLIVDDLLTPATSKREDRMSVLSSSLGPKKRSLPPVTPPKKLVLEEPIEVENPVLTAPPNSPVRREPSSLPPIASPRPRFYIPTGDPEYDKLLKAEGDKQRKKFEIIGEGKGVGRGLYSTEIEKIMKKYESFVGVFANDEYEKLASQVKPQSRGSAIVNTDNRASGGQHWQSIYWDARPSGSKSIEFYDSFADDITPHQQKGLKLIVDKLKPNTYLKMKINKVKHQSVTSDNCGYFAMKFLIDRYRGKTFAQASGYEDKVQSNVQGGEKQIESFKDKLMSGGCDKSNCQCEFKYM
jgi:hypothetical protein